MTTNNNDNMEKPLSKEEHIVNYVKILVEIDRSIEPFREHKADVKKSYQENGYLTKSEMSLALRAYRAMKAEEDLEKVLEYFNVLHGKIKV